MRETLLQKAHKVKSKKSYSKQVDEEMIEVAVAWIKGEVTQGQVCKAMSLDGTRYSTSILFQLCVALREGIKQGKINLTYLK